MEDVLNLSDIAWKMSGKISKTLASWEEVRCEAKGRGRGELSQLVFFGQFGKKFQAGSHADYMTRS